MFKLNLSINAFLPAQNFTANDYCIIITIIVSVDMK